MAVLMVVLTVIPTEIKNPVVGDKAGAKNMEVRTGKTMGKVEVIREEGRVQVVEIVKEERIEIVPRGVGRQRLQGFVHEYVTFKMPEKFQNAFGFFSSSLDIGRKFLKANWMAPRDFECQLEGCESF